MVLKERNGIDGLLAIYEEEKIKVVREGAPGKQRRLREMVLHKWNEMLAIEQSEIPVEILELAKYKMPREAATVLWMSPNPWDYKASNNENSVKEFIANYQANLWKQNPEKVVAYFRDISENTLDLKEKIRIPKEIKEFSRRLNRSVLQTIWRLPSPWLWGMDERDNTLDVKRSPMGMWKDGDKSQVVNYMRVVAGNLEILT